MQTILEVTGGVSSTDNSGLDLILEDIRDNWDETKAGSTRQAVELLDWAVGSSASEERIRVTVTDWMEPMGNDEQNDFAVGLARVKRFCELLQSEERQKLLEKAGIEEHVRFHDLRHTFSTLAIQSGIDPKTVAEILGHASAEFSLDVYTHVTAGMKKEAAQKISGFMASVG